LSSHLKVSEQDLLNVFHYFDYFRHALLPAEVWKYCSTKTTSVDVKNLLQQMVQSGALCQKNGFFALASRSEIIDDRIANIPLNNKLFKSAKWVLKLLKLIPFVKGVGISGSLSKHGATPDSDIDFFIITANNRVWMVKAIAIFIKKMFFLNSHKYLCVNYLLAEDQLALKKKNRFQAMEAVTLIPVYGKQVFSQFYNENAWISEFFPNAFPPDLELVESRVSLISWFFELFLKGRFGARIEQAAMQEFRKHGLKKYGAEKKKNGKFKYEKGESAYFPHDFEKEVLNNYELKTNNLAS
jgi:hypothetical protein